MPRPDITAERRLQILDAAVAVIAERGVCDARIADIADRIGASPPLILYYFPSKDVLLAEALSHRDQQFFAGVAAGLEGVTDAGERLRILVEESCPPPEDLGRDDNEWLLWLDLWSRARLDPGLAEARARMDGMFRTTIADIVRQGIADGSFRPVEPERFALQLTALIDGLAIQVLLHDPEVPSDVMRALCMETIRRELYADG